jgi:hypothetical protein
MRVAGDFRREVIMSKILLTIASLFVLTLPAFAARSRDCVTFAWFSEFPANPVACLDVKRRHIHHASRHTPHVRVALHHPDKAVPGSGSVREDIWQIIHDIGVTTPAP